MGRVMAGVAGLEPTDARVKVWCLTGLAIPQYSIESKMVGVAGFEPAALWSQTRCATKLRYTPSN